MVPRRELLRALVVSGAVGVAGCSTLIGRPSDQKSPPERTQTAVLTPTATTAPAAAASTVSPTGTAPDTEPPTTATTRTPTPTIAEQVGTPVYRPNSDIDEFGQAVTLSTGIAIVVAEEHGAYVFEADNGGWTHATVLTPTDRADFGGHEVSTTLAGDKVVIGGPEAGAVYLFERTADGWLQRHRFDPDDTAAGEFGRSVAFDGGRVVVGDANDPTTMVSYIGGAYVFARDDGDWTLEASLTTDAQDLFGTSVAVDGETVLVGAPFADPNGNQTGAVYAYERVDDAWQRQAVLSPADSPEVYDARFGNAVALSGDTAVVGAPEIPRGTGRAYVFERGSSGWSQVAHLTTPDISEGAEFGRSVALVGDTAVVGAPHAHGTGRAYVFTASDAWTGPLRLAAADPHEDAEFGVAVALSDTSVLVGAPVFRAASGAYLFDL